MYRESIFGKIPQEVSANNFKTSSEELFHSFITVHEILVLAKMDTTIRESHSQSFQIQLLEVRKITLPFFQLLIASTKLFIRFLGLSIRRLKLFC